MLAEFKQQVHSSQSLLRVVGALNVNLSTPNFNLRIKCGSCLVIFLSLLPLWQSRNDIILSTSVLDTCGEAATKLMGYSYIFMSLRFWNQLICMENNSFHNSSLCWQVNCIVWVCKGRKGWSGHQRGKGVALWVTVVKKERRHCLHSKKWK